MNDPTEPPHDLYDPWAITSTDIEPEERRRLKQTYRQQEAEARRERRVGWTLFVCAAILGVCVLAAQIYGAWRGQP